MTPESSAAPNKTTVILSARSEIRIVTSAIRCPICIFTRRHTWRQERIESKKSKKGKRVQMLTLPYCDEINRTQPDKIPHYGRISSVYGERRIKCPVRWLRADPRRR